MIPIVKADGTVELEFIRQLKKRSGEVDEKVNQAVAQIIAQVKERGDEAVREYTVKFDGRAPENLEISKKELKEAENKPCSGAFRRITPGSREYRRIFTAVRCSRAGWRRKGRRYFRAENPRLAACRPVCAGRHGGVSFLSADERYSGENRRGCRN